VVCGASGCASNKHEVIPSLEAVMAKGWDDASMIASRKT